MALPKQKPKVQLYCLLKILDTELDDRDDLGSIVGYSVLSSLLDYNPTRRKKQEKKAELMNLVDSGLEEVIHQCRGSEPFEVIESLQEKVSASLVRYAEQIAQVESSEVPGRRKPFRARIKKTILGDNGKVYLQSLRKRGLKLVDSTYSRGPQFNRQDVLNRDYNLLDSIFSDRGGLF